MGRVVRFIAYSDYLCPWCWNASRRLFKLADEYQGRIEILWRAYLLRPRAKAAARVGPEAFGCMHERLMSAYFSESRDISNFEVLRELWEREGLPSADFEQAQLAEIEQEILREHAEARAWGATGVPAIRRVDNDAVIVGAHPEALYRRWIERSLERGEGLVEAGSDDSGGPPGPPSA